jgi:hypothetical protein
MIKEVVKEGLLHRPIKSYVHPSFDWGVDGSTLYLNKRVAVVLYELIDKTTDTYCGFSVCFLRWVKIPFSEELFKLALPCSEKWGVEGWSYMVQENALIKYLELKRKLNEQYEKSKIEMG